MKSNNFLRYGIFAGLALIPFTPLVVTSSLFFPFITGKNFMFRILVGIITALWLVLVMRDPSARPKNSLILWGAGALLLVTTLATIFGLNPYRSFWSNYERMDGLITQIHLLLYFLVLTGVLSNRRYWYQFFNVNLVAAFCVAVYALGQLLGIADIHQGGVRIDATLGNAAYMAVYMLINLFLALYLAIVSTKNTWMRVGYVALSTLFATLLYLTQTRGTILGLVGGLFVFGLILAWRGEGRIKKASIGLLIGLVIFVGLFISIRDTAFVKNNQTLNRFASISLTEQTTTSRFTIWGMSLKAVAERPILGWGPENYVYVFSKYYDPVLWRQEPWFDRSHNVFLDWLVTAGVLGLATYLFLFGSAIYYLAKVSLKKKEIDSVDNRKRNQKLDQGEMVGGGLLIALLLAYFVHNFFVFDNLISYILFFSLLAYIHTLATENKKTIFGSKIVPEWGTYAVSGLLVVVFVFTFYFASVKPIMASRSLIRAMTTSSPETKLSEFKRVFSLDTFGSREALEQYLTSVSSILGSQTVDASTKQAYGQLALDQIAQQAKMAGPDARPYIIFGSFMAQIGRFDEALNYLNQGLSYSPKKQIIYFQLASVYLNQNNFNKALDIAKKAVDLDPTYPEANLMYALVAIYSGKIDVADQILSKWHEDSTVIQDNRLISVYTYIKRMDKVREVLLWRVAYFEKLIKDNPAIESNYISLADTWERIGDKQKTSEALTRLIPVSEAKIKENPDLVDSYLSLAQVYFRLGNNQKVDETINTVIGQYEEKIKKNPRDTDSYVVIADIYLKAGRADLAKQVIERAVATNPSFRYKAAEFLKKIPTTPAASVTPVVQ